MLGRFLKHDENKIVMIVHRDEEIQNYYFFLNRLTMILSFIIVAIVSE